MSEHGETLSAAGGTTPIGAGAAVLAFDVGGTDIKSALFDATGTPIGLNRTPTPAGGDDSPTRLIARLAELGDALRAQHPEVVPEAVGVVVPGIVDAEAGVGVFSSNLGWRDAPLRDLAAAVNASEVTVRRDLVTLERQGLIERAHGGAQLPDALIIEPWPTAPPDPETTAKSAIAALAATLVGDATAIMLGAGTTVYELARRLAPRSPLTVLTNSMLVARALARTPNVELVMTRGSLDNSTLALVGSAAEHWIAGQRVTRAFVSGGGLTTERGLSSTHLAVSEVERAIVGSAKELVVLADHTKLGVESTYPVAPVTRIDHLVTDTSGDASVLESLSSRGVHVHVAPSDLAGATA